MFYKEFAIEPSQIKSLQDLRWIEARFGYERGALISFFPGKWVKEVLASLQAANADGQIDLLTELLRDLKARVLHSYSRPYGGENWVAAAKISHQALPFHRVVESTVNEPPVWVSNIYNLADEDFYIIPECKRSAESISLVAEALLSKAEKVTLIDPYACATRNEFKKVLLALMSRCEKDSVEFVVFSEEDNKPEWSHRKAALDAFKTIIPNNITLIWASISDDGTGRIHPRALFTAKGGINFDRGFEEPSDMARKEEPNLLNPLSRVQLEQFAMTYNLAQLAHPLKPAQELWKSK